MLRLLAVGALCFAVASAAHAARFALATPWYLGGDSSPDGSGAVVVADFDGDGRDDIAVIGWAGYLANSQVSVSLQRADGTMGPVQPLVSPYAHKHHLHAADVDGDGAEELLVGHAGGLLVHSLGTDGWTVESLDASSCTYLASADIDGDGAVDILCQGQYGVANLFRGNAGVGIAVGQPLEIPGFGGPDTQVILADATGDDWPDMVLAAWGQNAVYVLPNDRAGGFEPGVVYPLPGDNVVGTPTVAVADLDADGANEIIAVEKRNSPNGQVFVWRRGVDGFMRFDQALLSLDMPSALLAEDMDGDSHPELIVSHVGYSTLSLYIGTADGPRPVPMFTSVSTQHGTGSLAVGDVDSDGQRDVVMGTGGGVTVLYGGREQPVDLDADLVSDLVWRHASGRNAVWAAADHRLPIAVPTTGQDWSPAASGQFDTSQGTELLFRHGRTGTNTLWGIRWGDPVAHSTWGNAWRVAGVGDYDGDGASDVLWRNASNGVNQAWLSADPQRTMAVRRLADLRWNVAGVGDFDGDGDSDVLWRHAGSGANIIWGGADRARQRTIPGAGLDWDVAGIGDFDRDGEGDVVWRNRQTGVNAIWRSAEPSTPWPIRAVADTRWTIAAIGDYNGDGYSDVLWWHSGSGRNAIWLGADHQRQKPLRDLLDTRWRVAH